MGTIINDKREIINREICTEIIMQYNKHYDEIKGFLKEYNITIGQYEILRIVSKYNGITQKELTKELIIAKANIGQSIFKLKMAKLVSYEKRLNKQYIHLTQSGIKILEDLKNRDENFYKKKYINLTDCERLELYKLLKLINKN